MAARNTPAAPQGLGPAGKRLWSAVLGGWSLEEHELALLTQACHVADACDALQALVDRDGVLLDGKAHPALVEARQQRITLGRLLVALRVPLGEQQEQDAPRSQRRGLRGVYGGAA